MARSLPPISAKLIADIEGFVADFKKAENATRRSTAAMDAQIDKFTKDLKRKFSAADIGKSILGGVGLGSGFAIAQTAVNQLTSLFERQAQLAKEIEESTANQLQSTLQLISARQTDEQRAQKAQETMLRTLREMEEAAKKKVEIPWWLRLAERTGIGAAGSLIFRGLGKETITAEVQALGARAQAEGTVADALKRSNEEREKQKRIRDAEAGLAEEEAYMKEQYAQLAREIVEAERERAEALKEEADQTREIVALYQQEQDELKKLQEHYSDLADPLAKYVRQLDELARLQRSEFALAPGAAKTVEDQIYRQMQLAEIDALFAKLPAQTDRAINAAQELGFAFTSAFEDAILAAQDFDDVINGLIKDIARIMLRTTITEPIARGLKNWFGGFLAEGGNVYGGNAYIVGEKGPEWFVPHTSGVVVPNGSLPGAGPRGGDSFSFNYSIGAGVTAAELAPILAMHKRDLLGTIADAKRRKTGLGSAL